jgi:hypothetical protein
VTSVVELSFAAREEVDGLSYRAAKRRLCSKPLTRLGLRSNLCPLRG